MVRNTLLTLLLLAWGVATPAVTQEHGSCPEATATARFAVTQVASAPEFNAFRAEHQLPQVASESVQALSAADQAICGRLHRFVASARPAQVRGEWTASFFRVGDHYYVVAERERRPRGTSQPNEVSVQIAANPVLVLDSEFNEVGRVAVQIQS